MQGRDRSRAGSRHSTCANHWAAPAPREIMRAPYRGPLFTAPCAILSRPMLLGTTAWPCGVSWGRFSHRVAECPCGTSGRHNLVSPA